MIARDDWVTSGRLVEFGARPHPYEVFVRESGSGQGEAILFLGGFAASSWEWADLEPYLSGRFRLGFVDFLGTGESSEPPRRHSFLEQFHVARAALGALGFERFHLVAHAHGVSIAQQFLCDPALRERIASLTLLNGAAYGEPHAPVAGDGVDGETAAPEAGAVSLGRRLRNFLRPLGRRLPPASNGARKTSQRLARYAAERAEFGPMWEGALDATAVPLAAIWGMRDAEHGPGILARIVAGQKRFPNVTTLPDVGALPHVEAPERVAAALSAFVCSLAPASAVTSSSKGVRRP